MTSAIQNPDTPSASPIGKVLVPVFLIVFTDIMGFGLMIPLLPFYAEHFGASAFTVGMLLSVFALCQLLAGPPLGQLSDRIGRQRRLGDEHVRRRTGEHDRGEIGERIVGKLLQ